MGVGGGHCCRLQHEPHYAACMQHATCNMQRTACSIPATCSTQLCSMSADMHHKYAHAMRMRFPERRRVCAARLHATLHIVCRMPHGTSHALCLSEGESAQCECVRWSRASVPISACCRSPCANAPSRTPLTSSHASLGLRRRAPVRSCVSGGAPVDQRPGGFPSASTADREERSPDAFVRGLRVALTRGKGGRAARTSDREARSASSDASATSRMPSSIARGS